MGYSTSIILLFRYDKISTGRDFYGVSFAVSIFDISALQE